MSFKSKKHMVIKNFMEFNVFKSLQKLINSNDFNWHYHESMTGDSKLDLGFFTHSFYDKHNINSDYYYNYIKPILKKLGISAIVQARANMIPSVFFKKKKSGWHTDNSLLTKTAIFYLNDCDGGTELKINKKNVFIKAEANKMLIFDSSVLHRGTESKDVNIRYIINFNYF